MRPCRHLWVLYNVDAEEVQYRCWWCRKIRKEKPRDVTEPRDVDEH
jgi:hypothetical protein